MTSRLSNKLLLLLCLVSWLGLGERMAHADEFSEHYNRGMPTGRTYSHRCNSCQTTFDSISTWRALVTLASGVFIASIGFSFLSLFVIELFDHGLDA
mgnify:CR=1 FL=1